MVDTDTYPLNLVNSGILLVISGAVGVFLFDGTLSLVAGLVIGIGATPVFATTRRDSTRSFGVGMACFLWAFMVLANISWEVIIGLGVVGFWFLGTADIDSTNELMFQGTVGKKANEEEQKDDQ
ncbi:hypothetical protein [Natrinema hispanicum]|uniref:Uncharacterized protein n=1 Tax=Natrinema hispanicum TaxID=392421 RepID=A0A1G6Z6Y2_9EURY|nr:hypothetical protein [Natrinema hispanicum]SDD97727.1 hypothetical protein SAMN05192552_10876 [Natrinema hispanicum]SEU11869.1 hypothetical protein SAMN04488694_15110 [Natrinema hispanicum]